MERRDNVRFDINPETLGTSLVENRVFKIEANDEEIGQVSMCRKYTEERLVGKDGLNKDRPVVESWNS